MGIASGVANAEIASMPVRQSVAQEWIDVSRAASYIAKASKCSNHHRDYADQKLESHFLAIPISFGAAGKAGKIVGRKGASCLRNGCAALEPTVT